MTTGAATRTHSGNPGPPPLEKTALQRQCACGLHTGAGGECTECRKKKSRLQRSAAQRAAPRSAPPLVHEVIASPGQRLDRATRKYMEPRFGRSFGDVRVHTDAVAARSASSVNALAYTVGQHVVFGTSQYSPRSAPGRRLLAHELTHTLQQRQGPIPTGGRLEISTPDCHHEREASRTARAVTGGGPVVSDGVSPTQPAVQRLGDLSKVPPDLACPVAISSPGTVVQEHLFPIGSSVLSPAQIALLDNFVTAWHAAGTNPSVRVDGYASTDGSDELNWRLSCDRAAAVVHELETPSSGATGIPTAFIESFAHGETDEFSPTAFEPNRRAQVSTPSPLPAPVCTHPGVSRSLDLQPVFFRTDPTDASPTGGSFTRRLNESNTIWGKLGVTFNAMSGVTLDSALKSSGDTLAERNSIRALRTAGGVEVFMMNNDLASAGGGATTGSGSAAAKIVLSDLGTSDTLLAHELGHVLGLRHPGDGTPNDGEANTIMEPSGSNSTPNPTRNTITNFNRITFPAGTGSTCLNPDP